MNKNSFLGITYDRGKKNKQIQMVAGAKEKGANIGVADIHW